MARKGRLVVVTGAAYHKKIFRPDSIGIRLEPDQYYITIRKSNPLTTLLSWLEGLLQFGTKKGGNLGYVRYVSNPLQVLEMADVVTQGSKLGLVFFDHVHEYDLNMYMDFWLVWRELTARGINMVVFGDRTRNGEPTPILKLLANADSGVIVTQKCEARMANRGDVYNESGCPHEATHHTWVQQRGGNPAARLLNVLLRKVGVSIDLTAQPPLWVASDPILRILWGGRLASVCSFHLDPAFGNSFVSKGAGVEMHVGGPLSGKSMEAATLTTSLRTNPGNRVLFVSGHSFTSRALLETALKPTVVKTAEELLELVRRGNPTHIVLDEPHNVVGLTREVIRIIVNHGRGVSLIGFAKTETSSLQPLLEVQDLLALAGSITYMSGRVCGVCGQRGEDVRHPQYTFPTDDETNPGGVVPFGYDTKDLATEGSRKGRNQGRYVIAIVHSSCHHQPGAPDAKERLEQLRNSRRSVSKTLVERLKDGDKLTWILVTMVLGLVMYSLDLWILPIEYFLRYVLIVGRVVIWGGVDLAIACVLALLLYQKKKHPELVTDNLAFNLTTSLLALCGTLLFGFIVLSEVIQLVFGAGATPAGGLAETLGAVEYLLLVHLNVSVNLQPFALPAWFLVEGLMYLMFVRALENGLEASERD